MKSRLLVVWMLMATGAHAQDPARLAEDIFQVRDANINYAEQYEALLQRWSHPVNLNHITTEELRALMILTETEVQAVVDYRKRYGPFVSIYEIQSIPDLSPQKWPALAAVTTVPVAENQLDASLFERIAHERQQTLLLRAERTLEQSAGYRSDSMHRYAGSADHLVVRYRLFRTQDFSAGFALEKDAGEAMTWAPDRRQWGFDQVTWHLQVMNKGRIKNLIVGDFQAQFGQGLVLGSAFGLGKNAETITTVRRSNIGFLPNTSLQEGGNFHGLAFSVDVSPRWRLHAFGSDNWLDGTVKASADSSFTATLRATGLHRNTGELAGRKTIHAQNAGLVMQFHNTRIDAGVLSTILNFDPALSPTSSWYQQAQTFQQPQLLAGAYLNAQVSHFAFFSELAKLTGGGAGLVAGVLTSLTTRTEWSLLVRHYDPAFVSLYSNAFSENSDPINETGFYTGLRHNFNRRFSISAYADLFHFPWMRFGNYAPSDGWGWLWRATWAPDRATQIYFQWRAEMKDHNMQEGTAYTPLSIRKDNFTFRMERTNGPWRWRTTLQGSTLSGLPITTGIAIAQEAGHSGRHGSVMARCAVFDTDNYDNRLYFYEQDVPGAYSFPAYAGRGTRVSLLASWKVSRHIDLWIRWTSTRYDDRTETGSGLDRIDGNTRNDVKFQARMRF